MFENKFTRSAETALKMAEQFAIDLGHSYIGTEHIFLGLLGEGQGVAARMLALNGISFDKALRRVETLLGKGEPLTSPPSGFTPRTKRVMELSYDEVRRFGHKYVGTEHLLMAILREGENVALRLLADMGADPQKIYGDIVNFISEEGPNSQKTSKQNAKNTAKSTPTLTQFGRDLTEMARENKFDPIIGRDNIIERVIQILSRRTKNNPCLIGEPGVGKTAVAEGLAQKIAAGAVPETLKDKRVFSLDLSGMIAGAKYRGEFEDRLKKCMEEIRKSGNIILFIDEMHTIIGAGAAEGAIDAANILKPALSRGEIQVIGATTLEEYRKYVEKDAALERRFQPITLDEPSEEAAIEILKGIRDKYEAHHKVKITDEAIEAAVKLSVRYIPDRFLPDKAIDLIDEASSRLRLKTLTAPPDLKEIEETIARLGGEKEAAIRAQEYEKAARFRDEETAMREKLNEMKTNWEHENSSVTKSVYPEDIAEIISSWTNIPVRTLEQEESERLLKLEEILHQRVIGQREAVTAISKAIRRGRVGLKDPKRPTGSFIFLGPTGVGKTELSKALAEAMFGNEDSMIRIDMSEYMEKHAVSRLVGSPPGYVGYDEGGQLTEKVRRKPYSVILFDEIEKAHPDVFNILLQILEDGILTDSQGRRVDFRNTVIIMTSNLGARMINENKRLGFNTSEGNGDYEKIKADVLGELKRAFRPEFLNRIDDTIVFHQLTPENIKEIAKKMLDNLKSRLNAQSIEAVFTDELVAHIADEGFDITYGARPLRRAIQSKIEDAVAEMMLEGKIKSGDNIKIGFKDGKVVID